MRVLLFFSKWVGKWVTLRSSACFPPLGEAEGLGVGLPCASGLWRKRGGGFEWCIYSKGLLGGWGTAGATALMGWRSPGAAALMGQVAKIQDCSRYQLVFRLLKHLKKRSQNPLLIWYDMTPWDKNGGLKKVEMQVARFVKTEEKVFLGRMQRARTQSRASANDSF